MSKPQAHQRPNLATPNNIENYPIWNPPTGRSYCPDGSPHHWMLETPSGKSTCRGECKRCGDVRDDHRTSSDETLYPVDARGEGDAFARRAEAREARRKGSAA